MRFAAAIQRLGDHFLDLFFPPVCVHCERLREAVSPIPLLCHHCLENLRPVPVAFIEDYLLPQLQPLHLDYLWAAYWFDDLLQTLSHPLKYQKMPRLGIQLGAFLQSRFPEPLAAFRADWVLPVPLHPLRLKEREYNQSACLARGMFAGMSGRLSETLLTRHRYTGSQTRLSRSHRRRNVREAFLVTRPQLLRGKAVLLVDDIFTTGATMNECARVLKAAGARRVGGITLGTPLRDDWEENEGQLAVNSEQLSGNNEGNGKARSGSGPKLE